MSNKVKKKAGLMINFIIITIIMIVNDIPTIFTKTSQHIINTTKKKRVTVCLILNEQTIIGY